MSDDAASKMIARLLRRQAVLGVIAAALMRVFASQADMLATLAGCGIGIGLTVLVAAFTMMRPAAAHPEGFLRAMHAAEALKFVLAIAAFALAAWQIPDHFLAVVLGYATTVFAYWLTGLRDR